MRRGTMFLLLLPGWLSSSGPLCAADDVQEIVRRALRNDARNRQLEHSYTYVERDEQSTLDRSGAVKHRESKTWDVIPLEGSQYRRLIQRDDKPLTHKEEQEQEDARRKAAEARARLSPGEREKRREQRARDREKERRELDEVVDGFELRMAATEQVDGMPVWVIDGTPRPGYRFQSRLANTVFSKMKGRIWISQSDYQPVRIDAETTSTMSFGGILARIDKGTRIHVEYTYVNHEVWLPKRISFSATGRLLLLKGIHEVGESTYRDYKKFSTDSRIVDTVQ